MSGVASSANGTLSRNAAGRLAPFAVSFLVTCTFFINVCAWFFECGCHALWAGAALTCNIHSAGVRHCPICRHGVPGYIAVFALVCAPQLLASSWPRWNAPIRLAACLTLFPVAMISVGFVLGWYDGYWR